MNERFLRFLDKSGWKPTESPHKFIKVYDVLDCGIITSIPVCVNLFRENNEGYFRGARISFVLDTLKHTSRANSSVILNNAEQIACTLNEAGLMLALKFVIFSRPTAYFKKPAKVIMSENMYVLPT